MRDVDVKAPACDQRVRDQLGSPRDDDGVGARDGLQCIERLTGGDAEPAPLAGRETPVAVVPAQLAARGVDDRPVGRTEPAPFEEGAVVVTAEEARLLALRPACGCQASLRRLLARLRLRLVAQRERDALQRSRVEPGEHVRLVLVGIGRPRQQQASRDAASAVRSGR